MTKIYLQANSRAIDDEQEMKLMGKHNNTSRVT
jgi:hypothetical protein